MPAAINMECQKERLHDKLKLPHRLYFTIVEKANSPLLILINKAIIILIFILSLCVGRSKEFLVYIHIYDTVLFNESNACDCVTSCDWNITFLSAMGHYCYNDL